MPQSPILAGVETIRGLWEAAGAARLLLHHKVSTIVQEHGLLLRHGTLFSTIAGDYLHLTLQLQQLPVSRG